jgi:polyisoprenoid-binding protein YceI
MIPLSSKIHLGSLYLYQLGTGYLIGLFIRWLLWQPTKSRKRIMLKKALQLPLLIAVAALLLAACAPQAAPTEPAATAAPAAASTATSAPEATTPPEPTQAAENAATATPEAAGAPSGGAVKFVIVAEKTTASYKVREQLAQRDLPNDAIGSTQAVSGAIVLGADGSIDSKNSLITVDASTLQTDQSMRDNFVRRSVLQTDQYKNVTFVPTQISGLPSPIPTSGPVTFKLNGDLTIRNVTKPVTWDVTGTVNGDTASGTATTSFKFGDFSLSQPQVPVVLSIVDNITLQIDLTLQRSSN